MYKIAKEIIMTVALAVIEAELKKRIQRRR